MKRKTTIVLTVVVMTLAITAGLAGCGTKNGGKATPNKQEIKVEALKMEVDKSWKEDNADKVFGWKHKDKEDKTDQGLTVLQFKNTGAIEKANANLFADKLIDVKPVEVQRTKVDGVKAIEFRYKQTIESEVYNISGLAFDWKDKCYVVKYAALNEENAGKEFAKIRKGMSVGTKESKPREPEIVDSGYAVTGDGSDYYIKCGVLISNTNKDHSIESPTFKVAAKDKKGNVLDTDEQTISSLAAGETKGYAVQILHTKKKPAKVEFEMVKVDEYSWKESKGEIVDFDAKKIKSIEDEFDSKVTGILVNNKNEEYPEIAISAIFRDGKGKIRGGDTSYMDGIGKKAKTPFAVDLLDKSYMTKDYDIFVQTW